MKNMAVYEGARDIPMTVTASNCGVAWTVVPTSDELGGQEITGSRCAVDPAMAELFYVSRTGLMIRKSTTSENGGPISTAGLYIADCKNNREKTGAKLLVVRKYFNRKFILV